MGALPHPTGGLAGGARHLTVIHLGSRPTLPRCAYNIKPDQEDFTMRGGLLWLLGIPIPIIILLYLFHVI